MTANLNSDEINHDESPMGTIKVNNDYPELSGLTSEDARETNSDLSEHEHEHIPDPDLRDLPLTLWNIPRWLLLSLIRLYQATFSRTLPQDTCRFYPSCSHYGYQAIYKYGVIKGGLMASYRILRCNPFNRGGFDPVP